MTLLLEKLPGLVLVAVLGLSIGLLSKATDILVDEAISLSLAWGISELVVGATIVSLGTSLPELAVSISATLRGNGILALGNVIGSTFVNTSFILGLGALYGGVPVNRKTAHKHALLSGLTLVLITTALPVFHPDGQAQIPQWLGVLFLLLTPAYFYWIVREGKADKQESVLAEDTEKGSPTWVKIVKLLVSAGLVMASAAVLVDTVEIGAARIGVPDTVIASTVVAFGTGLPEISTTIVSVKKGYGALAIGNIMGSNLLNTLLVLGVPLAFAPGGLRVSADFYQLHFPAVAVLLLVVGYFFYNTKREVISRREGYILILLYFGYLLWNYLL